MPDPGVNIKVAVTGAEASKQAMAQVGQAAQQAEAAGAQPAAVATVQQAAAAQKNLAAATGESAEAQLNFNRKAEGVVRTLVGMVRPELSHAAGFAFDLAEGFNKITPAMLKVGGVAAGIGATIAVVRAVLAEMAQAARDADDALKGLIEAQERLRESRLSDSSRLESELNKAGVFGGGPGAMALRDRLVNEQDIPPELAERVAVAAQVHGGTLSASDYTSLAAGILAGAELKPTRNQAADRAQVEKIIQSGDARERRAALEAHKLAMMPETERARSTPEGRQLASDAADTDAAIQSLKRAGVMSDAEEEIARGVLQRWKKPADYRSWWQWFRGAGGGDAEDVTPAGSDETIANIVSGVENAKRSIRARRNTQAGRVDDAVEDSPLDERTPATPGGRVIHQTIINTNAIYSGPRGPRAIADYTQMQSEWE